MKNVKKQLKENTTPSNNENFKSIPGFSRYDVSNQGRIRSYDKDGNLKQIISPANNGNGYMKVNLVNDKGQNVKWFVHRLVLFTFLGRCPKGYEVNHKNRLRVDNRLSNLEYKKISENRSHPGESHGNSKLREVDVRAIRDIYSTGTLNQRQLAEYYEVDRTLIGQIVRNEIWTHLLPTQITEENKHAA